MKRLTFDFETRSTCDLKKSGAYKYSVDPTTQPTCLAFKIRGKSEIHFFDFEMINTPWKKLPVKLRILWDGLIINGYEFTAHNAFFETTIYKNILVKRYGWPDIDFRQFRCTAAKAAACALPRSLENAGAALNLTTQKDRRGYVAMMATCKPSKPWKYWKENQSFYTENKLKIPPMFLEPQDAPEVWQALYNYCRIDVRTEELLDKSLPDLSEEEQEIWFLNQKLNWRGLRVDIPTIKKIVGIMEVENKIKLKELDSLTMGLVTKAGATKSILDFLELEGVKLKNLQKKTVDDTLQEKNLTTDTRSLLELRKALSLTSTKKYQSFLHRAGEDSRVRDILLYHGASTGRDTGTGVQPHNFPRGILRVSKERPYAAIENVIECDVETLKLLYGESLGMVFSSILRNMILPSIGHELFVADFSKIEVAILWWLSDNWPGLKILHQGLDPYKYMASANTGRLYIHISDEGDERQLGKAQVLGCGFGMGWRKFQTTAFDMYRLKLTDEESQRAVKKYREQNAAVPLLWKEYENYAIEAVRQNGTKFKTRKCEFQFKDKFLWVTLPSGRKLAYREPSLTMRETDYGSQETLEFMAVNSKTKKWSKERTWGGTLTENIVQAVARDLMMQASVRLEKAGYKFLLSIHDEAITEKPIGEGSIQEFTSLMCQKPKWADTNLPLEAKAWKGPRYRK